MTPLQAAAVDVLRIVPAGEAHDIAALIRDHRPDVPRFTLPELKDALRELDDGGHVFLRGGFYRLTERAKWGAA